ncbi:hypothetical protein KIL84_001173 [Mauremys mutica]|uniref:E3 ubiquitin-protein ligase RNF4 n=1 Tax=Mauremys mutica TaxID=74926 RepID=A0A9D4ATG5_9SAUR|nr:hypothetical protein KIL84_001173 [Mauremys mutica]
MCGLNNLEKIEIVIQMQRKRRGGAINSRQTRKRNRLVASATEMASEAEPIELEESAGEEVVDLTCESSEPVVVDLTHNDSVVVKNQRQQRNLGLRSQRQSDSCVLSSDDEDESRDNDVYVTNKVSGDLGTLEDETASSRPSGTVSCPICMDGYSEADTPDLPRFGFSAFMLFPVTLRLFSAGYSVLLVLNCSTVLLCNDEQLLDLIQVVTAQ